MYICTYICVNRFNFYLYTIINIVIIFSSALVFVIVSLFMFQLKFEISSFSDLLLLFSHGDLLIVMWRIWKFSWFTLFWWLMPPMLTVDRPSEIDECSYVHICRESVSRSFWKWQFIIFFVPSLCWIQMIYLIGKNDSEEFNLSLQSAVMIWV